MNAENNKTIEPHNFFLKLAQRLDLENMNKHVALQIYLVQVGKYEKAV